MLSTFLRVLLLLVLSAGTAQAQWTPSPAQQAWLQAHPTIRIAIDSDFPPYSFVDQGKLQGYAIDYLALLEKRLKPWGVHFELIPYPAWDELYADAIARKVDAVATMVDRPERRRWFLFTRPYIFKSLAIFTRRDDDRIRSRDDLAGKQVALVRDYNASKKVLAAYPSVKPLWVERLQEALLAVSADKADAAIAAPVAGEWYARRYLIDNLKVAAFFDHNNSNESIGVRNDWPQLVDILQATMDDITPDELNTLNLRWIHPLSGIPWEKVYRYGLALGALLLIMALWLWQIQRKNRQLAQANSDLQKAVKELNTLRQQLEEIVAQRTAELPKLAQEDPLTGLLNRRAFMKAIQAQLDGGMHVPFALFFVDLNRFKYINDTLGHAVGDALLKQVSKRLRETAQQCKAVAARLGGDEFAFLIPGAQAEKAIPCAQQVIEALGTPFRIKDESGGETLLSIGASVGIALFPQHGITPLELLERADLSLYQAKQRKGGWYLFDEKLLAQAQLDARVDQALRTAIRQIEAGQSPFSLVYQPIICCHEPSVLAYEALLRWPDQPEGENWGPDIFIPIAEENGTIHIIGQWLLDTAFAQAARLLQQQVPFEHLAINLSPVQLLSLTLVDDIQALLQRHGVPSHRIAFEITESAAFENTPTQAGNLRRLRQLGFKLAIDDFGSGHNEFDKLNKLRPDIIKIDKSLTDVLAPDNFSAAMIRAIAQISTSMGTHLLIEGVETADKLVLARQLGVHCFQGYYFARPMDADALMQWQADYNRCSPSDSSQAANTHASRSSF